MIYLIHNHVFERNSILEKRKLKLSRIILWELVVPLFGTVLFTVLFAVLQKNYYYLPRGLDFLIQLFYNAKYIFLYASLFFFAGISAWIVLFSRGRDAAVLSVTGVLSVAIMPMISFAVALLLLRNDISDSLIENYLYSDALCALENAARYVIVIFLTVATRIFYHAHKTVPTFEKPYISLRGVGFSLITAYSAWLIMTLCGIFFSGSVSNIAGTVAYESILCAEGYFIGIAGAIYAEKKIAVRA